MPSGSSAPSLPSPELYSLNHFIWYDGLTSTSPSPEEGEQQLWKMPDDGSDDDQAKGEDYYTAPSTPTAPKLGASGSKDPAQPETEEDTGRLQYADMARSAQDIPAGGASSLLSQQAPPEDRLSSLSAFNALHGVGGSMGGDHSYSE